MVEDVLTADEVEVAVEFVPALVVEEMVEEVRDDDCEEV